MAEQIKPKESKEVAITTKNQLAIVQQWTHALTDLTTAQQVNLTQAEKEFGVSIIANLTDRCIKGGIKTNELNMTNFLEQVKHNSKLQLSIAEGELYLDIRNNKDTGLKDVKISRQYQGIQKLLRRHCTKKVIRFKEGVVGEGDIFEVAEDFDVGITKIMKHRVENETNQSNLYKIEKAYAIVYVEELGKIVPYTCIIDKKRILRAKGSASTDKVWISDTKAMVLKTAYWCLWAMMKPFIDLPVTLQESFVSTEDEMNFENPTPVEINTTTVYDINPESFDKLEGEDENLDTLEENNENESQIESTAIELFNGLPIIEIPYAEYQANKDKYEKATVEGINPYNKETKTMRVIEK